MLYFLILTFILSKNISADSADLVKKASKIKDYSRINYVRPGHSGEKIFAKMLTLAKRAI